jgi:hypothetical protein
MPDKLADLFYLASKVLGCEVLITTPWIAAEWLLAHHRDALDADDRDLLLAWAMRRRRAAGEKLALH